MKPGPNGRITLTPCRVTFGYRDVYWCHLVNEPMVLEFRGDDVPRRPFCIRCEQDPFFGDDPNEFHTFVCHVNKPPGYGQYDS